MSTATRALHRADQREQRVGSGDWGAITAEVNEHGGALLPRLLPIARDWHAKLGQAAPWPDTLDEWLRMCHQAGQNKPRSCHEDTGTVFTTRDRPVRSVQGWTAAPVRHGVSVIRSGQRYTLGLVFHDAA